MGFGKENRMMGNNAMSVRRCLKMKCLVPRTVETGKWGISEELILHGLV